MSPPVLSTPRSNANSADGGVKRPPGGKLTRYTLFVCIAAAFGGLTFGYDIGVSGGVTSNRDFLKKVRERGEEREREMAIGIGGSRESWRRGRRKKREEKTLTPDLLHHQKPPPPLLQFFPGVYCAVYDCSSKLEKPPPNPENDPYCKV